MRKALARLRKTGEKQAGLLSWDYWTLVERLLASFERITGKSFGEIPLNPSLSGVAGAGEREYRQLMDDWAAWWDWRPERNRPDQGGVDLWSLACCDSCPQHCLDLITANRSGSSEFNPF